VSGAPGMHGLDAPLRPQPIGRSHRMLAQEQRQWSPLPRRSYQRSAGGPPSPAAQLPPPQPEPRSTPARPAAAATQVGCAAGALEHPARGRRAPGEPNAHPPAQHSARAAQLTHSDPTVLPRSARDFPTATRRITAASASPLRVGSPRPARAAAAGSRSRASPGGCPPARPAFLSSRSLTATRHRRRAAPARTARRTARSSTPYTIHPQVSARSTDKHARSTDHFPPQGIRSTTSPCQIGRGRTTRSSPSGTTLSATPSVAWATIPISTRRTPTQPTPSSTCFMVR
jgi:hypothetical protein